MRVATIGFDTLRTSVSRSLATIVDEASSAADAVDMIAASAAASTSPVMPIGQHRLGDRRERLVGTLEPRDDDLGRGADQRSGDAVDHAVHAGDDRARADDLLAASR